MDEVILSGYCRSIDASRTVMVEEEAGEWFADCAFGACLHEAACPLAEKIREIKKRDAH